MFNFIRDEHLNNIIARKQFVKDSKEKLRAEKKQKQQQSIDTKLSSTPASGMVEEEKVPIMMKKEPKLGPSPLSIREDDN
mmetsp:Transcript_47634/g.62964  ORF Transcript_47634/g.62964 Transcript_47634/m.62964 type:complete len:80 (+) Transcript_47634:935-1174(+)